MPIKSIPLSLLFLLTQLSHLPANPPATMPATRPVGTVHGTTITAGDIGLTEPIEPVKFDSRNTARWQLMGRVLTAFGTPVVERFVAEKKIDATADEIAAFTRNMKKWQEQQARKTEEQLAKVTADLASPDLSDQKKAELEKTKAMLERILPAMRERPQDDIHEALARQFIVNWKLERELQRAYGGRVIFQQAGPEALDARRKLFEQAEKNGDLKFQDPGVRHLFYYYYADMRHTPLDENALERAWFLEDPK